jgi:DNA mismatch endonuclease (patch repair protein)
MDVHSKKQRAVNMRAIRSHDTAPENIISNILFSLEINYTTKNNLTYGKPDFLCPDYGAAIFVHGCFWHRHLCYMFKWPKTRPSFWKDKLTRNAIRDNHVINNLNKEGYKIMIIWECSLKGRMKISTPIIKACIEEWLCAGNCNCEISSLGISELLKK